MDDFFGVLSWVGCAHGRNAVTRRDSTLDHRKDVCGIGRLDTNSRPRVLHAFGGWQPSLESLDDAPIRASTAANPFSLYPTKQESQLRKEARSISGEWLQGICRGIVRDCKFEAATRQVGKSVPAAVDPHRSISCARKCLSRGAEVYLLTRSHIWAHRWELELQRGDRRDFRCSQGRLKASHRVLPLY